MTHMRVEKPGDYTIDYGTETIAVKDTENVTLSGNGCTIENRTLKQPNINLINSENVMIKDMLLYRTRIKAQEFSKNLTVDNVTFVDDHILFDDGHTASISAKTEWHVDNNRIPVPEFEWDYVNISNVWGFRPVTELFYIGSQKAYPHYFKKATLTNVHSYHSGREGGQISCVKDLYIDTMKLVNCGTKNIDVQNNGFQVSNSHGTIKNLTVNGTNNNGVMVFSGGLTFHNLKIDNFPDTGLFIGGAAKRFPDSQLDNSKDLIFYNTEIGEGLNGINVQTDEMKVFFINPKFTGSTANIFHPKSARANVHIIQDCLVS